MKRLLALVFLLLALRANAQQHLAPKPLYRDPIHDGASDPTLIYNRARHGWWMFYTNHRADLAADDLKDVTYINQTRIGVAVSKDHGAHWSYTGACGSRMSATARTSTWPNPPTSRTGRSARPSSPIATAELKISDGLLTTDRDAPAHVDLGSR